MKKLSFIMAVLMILMCMPVMAITSISAAEEVVAPDANAPETVTDISETNGNDYKLESFPDDETAARVGAIGRFTKEGGNGYAMTWKAVGGNSVSCGASVFYLIKNIAVEQANANFAIGRNTSGGSNYMDVGQRGVTIDGGLGSYKGGENYKITAPHRAFHFNSYATTATVTIKNVIINAKQIAQVNDGGTVHLVFDNVVAEATDYGIIARGKITLNNSSFLSTGNDVFLCDKNGAEITVNNSFIKTTKGSNKSAFNITGSIALTLNDSEAYSVNGGYVVCISGGEPKVTVNNTKMTYDGTNRGTVQCNGGLANVTINSGEFTAGYGFVMNTNLKTGSVININGGKFVCTAGSGVRFQSNGNITMNINGGSFECATKIFDNGATGDGALNFNITGGSFLAKNGHAFHLTRGATTKINVSGGVFQALAGQIIYDEKTIADEINISGGTFVSDGQRMIRLTKGGDIGHVLNISGGTFLAKNFDVTMDEFTGSPTPKTGLIFTELHNKINISGGNFTAYKDNGITLASECAFVYSWVNNYKKNADQTALERIKDADGNDYNYTAVINVAGGSYNGGKCFVANAVCSGDINAPFDEENSVLYYYTEGTNSVALAPKATQGASVRLDKDSSGLRFTATIDALALTFIKENLMKEDTEFTFGTMIVPSNYVKYAGGEITMAAFDKAGKAYLNIVAKDGVIVNEDGSVTINAAMTNIKKENYDRDFIAVAYIKYTDKTGAEVIQYAQNVTLAAFSRNVQEIAHAALADVLTTAAGTYTNKVDGYYVWNQNARKYEFTPGVAYSRYNAEQIAVLKSYILPTDAE